MRLILQISLSAAFAALMAAGFQRGWWTAVAEMPPGNRETWQQGWWPVQDRLAAEVGARARAAGATRERPLRTAIRMDLSAVPKWRFAALRASDWECVLARSETAAGAIVPVSADAAPPPDLTVFLVLRKYNPGAAADELEGIIRYEPAAGQAIASDFRAICPAHGRDWFVRPARRAPWWIMLTALAVLAAAGGLGIWAAWQTFTGQFDRSLCMNLCAVLVVVLFLTMMFAELAPPGYGQFGIPRWSVRVVLDTSDAVRFPPAGAMQRPAWDGASSAPAMNDVCRFVEQSVRRIARAVNADNAPAGAGFRYWLRYAWQNLGRARLRSGLLRASENVRIYHGLPPAGAAQDVAAPPAGAVDLEGLPELLQAGHRGQPPGFFLPWAGLPPGTENELIVAFGGGEPASLRQADWLASERARLRAAKPAGLRVLTVLLPALPRSKHPGWSTADRLRNAAAVSDAVLAALPLEARGSAPGDLPAPVAWIPVFTAAGTNPPALPADLDAERTRQFQADPGRMRAAAARIAEKAQGMSDVRGSAIFQTAPAALIMGVCAAAGLLLFLRLQREIRLLDRRRPADNLEWLGALAGIGMGLCAALLICYMAAEPLRWRTLVGPGLALWAAVCIWYAAAWLPMLLGRGLGLLPAPEKMLRVRHLAGWFLTAAAAAVLSVGAGCCWALLPGREMPGWAALAGMGITAAAFLSMALRYQWVSFWRRSRRRTWCLGTAGLGLLLALPLWGIYGRDAGHWTPWIWAGTILVACVLPAAGALSARWKWGNFGARARLGLGWAGMIYGWMIGVLAPLVLLFPWPN